MFLENIVQKANKKTADFQRDIQPHFPERAAKASSKAMTAFCKRKTISDTPIPGYPPQYAIKQHWKHFATQLK